MTQSHLSLSPFQGRIYLLVEAASQFYRCFIPVQPWAAYLLNNYEGYDKIFGTVLVVAYVLWAFRDVLVAGKFLRESYIKFKQNSVKKEEKRLFGLENNIAQLFASFFPELWHHSDSGGAERSGRTVSHLSRVVHVSDCPRVQSYLL